MRRLALFFASGALLLGLAGACRPENEGGTGTTSPTPSPTPTAPPPGSVTYYEDVLPIVMDHCQACHTDGGVGPGAWDQYDVASGNSGMLASATADRIMPPWPPEPSCGHTWVGERLLTDEEKLTFQWWNDDGAPAGDPAAAPTPTPAPDPNYGLGTPDRILDPGTVTPTFGGSSDLYWCLRVDPAIATDTAFTALEILPENLAVVHHVLLFREPGGAGQPTGAPGFECGGIPSGAGEMIGGWTPGARPFVFPDGVGMQIPADDALLIQMHFHKPETNIPADDHTVVKLWFADGPLAEEAHIVWLGNPFFSIPGNATDYSVKGTCTVPQGAGNVKLLAIGPHMHEIGTQFKGRLERGGADTCLVDIARWDFEWQGTYQYDQPVMLQPGDKVHTECIYTNPSSGSVSFGEGTNDEMCFFFLTVTSEGDFGPTCFF